METANVPLNVRDRSSPSAITGEWCRRDAAIMPAPQATAATSTPAQQAGPDQIGPPADMLVPALRHDAGGQRDGGQPHGQVDPEHRAPADLDQAAADDGAEGSTQRGKRRPG